MYIYIYSIYDMPGTVVNPLHVINLLNPHNNLRKKS